MMKVSIVLPSYNRYPLNLYTLYALENQSFDLTKMEVILIDDASTDKTMSLEKYQAPYAYKYIRNNKNVGLATSRNIGARHARGEVLIFLDAEMLVNTEFVKCHYENHISQNNIVVVGGTERERIFSYLFHDYNEKQIRRIYRLIKTNSYVKDRITKAFGNEVNVNNLAHYMGKLKEPAPLIFKEDILNPVKLEPFILQMKNYNKLLTYLGEDFGVSPITWMTCGGIISVKKAFFEQVGGYEGMFKGWGPEDAEFAYRLKKKGAKFIIDPRIRMYHQEHPIHISKRNNDDKINWVIFQEKHPDLDICIRAINLISNKDYYPFIDKVLREKGSLNTLYPGKYKTFEDSLITMLKQIRILDLENKPIKELLLSSGLSSSTKRTIFKERNEIAAYKKYPHLLSLFDLLVST